MGNVIKCDVAFDNESKELGARIRLARVTAGLTQEEFAKEIGISRNYLGTLESGKSNPSFDILVKIDREIPGASGFSRSFEVMSHRIDTEVFGLPSEVQERIKKIKGDTERFKKCILSVVEILHVDDLEKTANFVTGLLENDTDSYGVLKSEKQNK